MEISSSDTLLREFAASSDGPAAEALLEQLVVTHAEPAVRRIVRYKLGFQGPLEAQDSDDVSADVLVDLIARLRLLRDGGEPRQIGAFSAYTAVAAYHACNEYLRRKYPNRHRLKNRLRYLLNAETSLALWDALAREWLCGFAQWRQSGIAPIPRETVGRWRELLQDLPRGQDALPPARLLALIFKGFGAPVEFDDLVEIVAELWGVEDVPPAGEREAAGVPSEEFDISAQLEQRQWLAALWEEVGDLPYPQRCALLLNLRLEQGGSAIALLPATGVAGLREVAERLGLRPDELAEIWNQLPLEDLAIAERLGVTRQQVINYRKSARERLIRRMSSRLGEPGRGNNQLDSPST